MKARTLALLAGAAGSLLIAGQSRADFLGLSADMTLNPGTTGAQASFAVYADFSDPLDRMLAVAGTPGNAMNIQAIGGTFYQHAGGTDRSPTTFLLGIVPDIAYDTYVTIGLSVADGAVTDATGLTPQWPGFSAGSLTGNNLAWFVTPGDPQSLAGSYVGNRVLLGVFTVQGGSTGLLFEAHLEFHISGSIGGPSTADVSFIPPIIPAPGAFALLGLAGLIGSRRRRR